MPIAGQHSTLIQQHLFKASLVFPQLFALLVDASIGITAVPFLGSPFKHHNRRVQDPEPTIL